MKSATYGSYTVFENGDVFNSNGKKLAFSYNGRGYKIIRLIIDGVRKTKAQHRLLAECFLPKLDDIRNEVNHKDGDKENNALDNLEWCTRSENLTHAYKNRLRDFRGENNPRCLTTKETVIEICKLLESGHSPSKIRDLGYSYSLVRKIKARANWKEVSKDFNF